MTKQLVFNEQQVAAIDACVNWHKGYVLSKHVKQVFFLAGYAGVGKTSVAMEIANRCGGEKKVVFIAPTGKAASRLRQKGCKFAKTMHSFIYNMRGENEEGEPIFVAKGEVGERPSLIICDEGSMLGDYDDKVLRSHGIPVLVLGDYGQVPPVKALQVYHEGNCDFLLDKIERQAESSNIVRLSMFVRQGKRPPLREYDDVKIREGWIPDETLIRHAQEDAVILCSFNNTRFDYNQRIRKLLGFSGALPNPGEKLVCTFNQHDAGFMNGEQILVEAIYDMQPGEQDEDDDGPTMRLRGKSLTTGKTVTLAFDPRSFSDDEEQRKASWKSIGGFDYGWVLTIHKSQGSEWDNVLVIEEMMKGVPYERMMYTAITRAVQHLMIFRDVPRYPPKKR